MLKDITLGQYFPGDTLAHKLDPRTKLLVTVLYIVALFTAKSYLAYGLLVLTLVVAVRISRVSVKALFKGLKPVLFIIAFTAVLNLFYTPGREIWHFWIFHMTIEGVRAAVTMMLRILLAVLCGGLIGLERERKNRPAGFRTYMLTALGATLTVLLSLQLDQMLHGPWRALAESIGATQDVSRFGAEAAKGIGFLGAGTIIITARQQVKGLTTAAGLWASACLGLAIGAGFYSCAFISMLFMIVCMYALPPLERRMTRRAHHMNISLEIERMEHLGAIVAHLHDENIRIFDFAVNRNGTGPLASFLCQFSAILPERRDHPELLAELSALEGVILIEEI